MIYNANWITTKNKNNKDKTSPHGGSLPYFQKTFSVSKSVKMAQIEISSLGIFKAYINGEEIGEDYFMPGWTDYNKRISFITYDITKLIDSENTITIIVGDGWYAGNIGFMQGRCCYGETLALIASINISFEDGLIENILTDASWKVVPGQIIYSDMFNGEYIDARINLSGYSKNYDDAINWEQCETISWPKDILEPMLVEGIRENATLLPDLIYKGKNIFRYNFKQNFAGVIRLTVKGKDGSKIVVKHGEMLNNDGSLYTANLRSAIATDTYICGGGELEIFQPLFTFHGFQYAEIQTEGIVEIVNVTGIVLHNDLRITGDFNCSNTLVNKIFNNTLWGQRSNFISIPTDCPQRDERLGWTGDAQIFCKTAMYNMDCNKFFAKYLTDVRDTMQIDGAIFNIAPKANIERSIDSCASPIWGDCITIIPYMHYLMYGDSKIIKENIESAKKWIDYCFSKSDNGLCQNIFTYGDWLSLEDTNKDVLTTAYLAYSALLTAKMLQNSDDADYYYKMYENVKHVFRSQFLNDDGTILGDTQTAYLIAFAFGLATKDEISNHLVRKIKQFGNHLSTGFVGVKYLLPVLCDIGESELAYELIAKSTFPSWGYSIVNGATTIWERWDSYTIDDGFKADGMNSFNHYTLGSCTEWLYEYVLGIRPCADGPGFSTVLIKPYLNNKNITSASGKYKSQNGDIEVTWAFKDELYIYEVVIPQNIKPRFEFDGYEIVMMQKDKNNHSFHLKKINK